MPIPDEKARAWTRPEDYWPPRRPSRSSRPPRSQGHKAKGHADPLDKPRLLLTTVPYAVLMICLAFLAIAVMIAAWPGQRTAQEPAKPVAAEIGTAPKGWLEGR